MTRSNYLRFLLIYGLCWGANICAGLMGPLVGQITASTNITTQAAGIVLGVQFLPYILGGTLAGRLISRMSLRTSCALGLSTIIAADIGFALAQSLPMLIAVAIIQGAGMLVVAVSSQVAISSFAEGESQARIISAWSTAPLMGVAAGLALGAFFADGASWRLAFITHAMLAGGLLIASALVRFSRRTVASSAAESSDTTSLRREPDVIRICVMMGFGTLVFTGSATLWPTYLSFVHDIATSTIGSLAAATMLAGLIGSFLVGIALSSAVPLMATLVGIAFLAIGGTTALYHGDGQLSVITLAMTAWNVAAGATIALIFACLPKAVRHAGNLGAATGLLYQVGCVGSMFGAPLFFVIAAREEAPIVFTALISGSFAAIILLCPIRRIRPFAAKHQPAGNV